MAISVNRPDIRMGFWIAVGFFAFGLVLALVQWLLLRLRNKAA